VSRELDVVDNPPSSNPDVSVIIVNYNGMSCIERLLNALGSSFMRYQAEIIVVDNASTDGSRELLARRGDIRFVPLQQNTGFAAGNNAGATYAVGNVLLLLNNDTAVSEQQGLLDRIVDAALDPDVGAVGCQLRYADGRLQHSIGFVHTPMRIALSWIGLEHRTAAPKLFRKFEISAEVYAQNQRGVAWVSGACLATRTEVWRGMAGLDEQMFMYCEDVDYCARLNKHGLRVDYLCEPIVTHFEAGGKAWPGSNALMRTCRSYFVLIRKTDGARTARLLALWLSAVFWLRSLVYASLTRVTSDSRRAVFLDKSNGFGRASSSLFRAAWSGSAPSLP
jgi:GT2 family glycosyltransferase